jgi:hypothetical protein
VHVLDLILKSRVCRRVLGTEVTAGRRKKYLACGMSREASSSLRQTLNVRMIISVQLAILGSPRHPMIFLAVLPKTASKEDHTGLYPEDEGGTRTFQIFYI